MSNESKDNSSSDNITDVISILSRLVACNSVSGSPNIDVIDIIEGLLQDSGAVCHRVPSDDGTRTNVFGTIGPMIEGGIVLSGHTDVVPVDGQVWNTNPFELTTTEDKFFGRGTCDMKGFIAVALAALPNLELSKLKRPLHFAFSYDEELGCLGAPRMIEKISRLLPKPSMVIIGEPTEMKVVSCHKGCLDITTEIRGRSIHSGLSPYGVSAISTAAKLISWLDARQSEGAHNADEASPLDPPFTTYHCGLIEGGTASNIVAKDCSFTTDIRVIENENANDHLAAYKEFIANDILPDMQAIAPEADIEVRIDANIPAFSRQDHNPAENLARAITRDTDTHASSMATEAGQFQQAGLPTIVCGPGSLEQAHKPDEFVSRKQLVKAVRFVDKAIATLSE